MKTATVADLRNDFPLVSRWIEAGEKVQITKRGRPFAVIAPAPRTTSPAAWPDLRSRLVRPAAGRTSETIDEARGEW